MYHLTSNPRAYNVANIVELAIQIARCWLANSALAYVKGKREVCNIVPLLRTMFDAEKKYNFRTKTLTGNEIISSAEAWAQKHDGEKFPVVAEGRHRAIGHFLATILLGGTDEPFFVEVNEDMVARITLEGNGANDFVTRLANSEKLAETVNLVNAGVYKREADLPFKRGTNQKLWAQAELVCVHGVSMEDAVKIDKEAARKAAKSMSVADAVAAALNEKAGNQKKVLSGSKIRDLLTMAKTADPNLKNAVSQILNAICEDLEMDAKVIVQKAIGVVQAAPEKKSRK